MEILKIIPYILYFVVIGWLGNFFCKTVVGLSGVKPNEKTESNKSQIRAGRYIGFLERLLISFGIIVKSWEIIAAVVALKTVARYKELDVQIKAEYFLIGSLASIVWAILVSAGLILYDQSWGFSILRALSTAVK